MCGCLCICRVQRERERDGSGQYVADWLQCNSFIIAVCLCVCQRERESSGGVGVVVVGGCVSDGIPACPAAPAKLNQRQSVVRCGGLSISSCAARQASAASWFSTTGKISDYLTFTKMLRQLFPFKSLMFHKLKFEFER